MSKTMTTEQVDERFQKAIELSKAVGQALKEAEEFFRQFGYDLHEVTRTDAAYPGIDRDVRALKSFADSCKHSGTKWYFESAECGSGVLDVIRDVYRGVEDSE